MSAVWHPIIALTELESRKEFEFDINHVDRSQSLQGFLLITDDGVRAYHNRCPHTGVSLNWSPHQFLDRDGAYVMCAVHGALFLTKTGECVHGPCVGQSLSALPVKIEDDMVYCYL